MGRARFERRGQKRVRGRAKSVGEVNLLLAIVSSRFNHENETNGERKGGAIPWFVVEREKKKKKKKKVRVTENERERVCVRVCVYVCVREKESVREREIKRTRVE